ncbi:hypothetical protein [Streptomyces sp. NBC_01546]|uniref:hypothetical protein n=1 Tax=Streptomyces sp. NBC_01546 TaxID=2975872 RepID=UPI0038687999
MQPASHGQGSRGGPSGAWPSGRTGTRSPSARSFRDQDPEPAAAPTAAVRAAPTPARRTLPAVLDPELAERPARASSGWWAVTAVLLAAPATPPSPGG